MRRECAHRIGQDTSIALQSLLRFLMNYGPPPIREMCEHLRPLLGERQRRLWAATAARALA